MKTYVYPYVISQISYNKKGFRENQNTHFVFNIFFFNTKLCRVRDKLKVEKYGKAEQTKYDNIIRCTRFACWITKATHTTHTHTHSEYVILIAFPRQQLLSKVPQCYVDTYIVVK